MTSESIIGHLLYLLFTPLLCAACIGCFFRKDWKISLILSLGTGLVIMGCTMSLLNNWDGRALQAYIEWFQVGSMQLYFGFLFDKLSLCMLLVVSVIGLLVQVFSVGYMESDPAKPRYFGGLCLFLFSMLGIVLADNLILLFIFWEWVGFSSYMLIAHYYETPFAQMASKKAFITNRVGDFFFLLGIVASYWHFGSFDIGTLEIFSLSEPSATAHLIGFLLIGGFLGKSAQFPLQVWLPDAMAGPTPVSALMHAATMVAAGIFLLARVYCLLTAPVLQTILWICTAMTLLGALCALGQSDIKKILAYSTLSQLAYMGVAMALESPGLSLFHLSTHAAFKAGLFLCAGAIIHALHHEQNIFHMGGLLKKMPFVSFVFICCMLSLCGIPGTAGFFSKDAILELSYLQSKPVYCVLSFTAFLTAFYMGRLFCIAFTGTFRGDHKVHPVSLWMTIPLGILALLSILSGYSQLWPESLRGIFDADLHLIHSSIHKLGLTYPFIALHTALGVLGFGLAFYVYRLKATKGPKALHEGPIYQALCDGLGIDAIYNRYIVLQQKAAKCFYFLDLALIGGLMMRGTAGLFALCSMAFKRVHSGSLQNYLYHFLAGFLLLIVFIFKVLNVCVCHSIGS